MELERVNIDDVFPVEDEFGNQYLSRDYSLKVNQEYVTELAQSFGENGEPDEPPVLVRDGGIYRIKAGNSRIMAMREIGTKYFTAVIDDQDTPLSLVEAAIRTDTKKKYEELEKSRFSQQLFLIPEDEYVNDAYISKMIDRPVSDVRKIRQTIEVVEDRCEDLTLDRMIALTEFEDDSDAYEEILNAPEASWRSIVSSHKVIRAALRNREELINAATALGIPILDKKPADMDIRYWIVKASDLPDTSEGYALFINEGDSGGFLLASTDEELDPDEQDKKAEMAFLEAKFRAVRENRTSWFLDHYQEEMKVLTDLYEKEEIQYAIFNYSITRFISDHELEDIKCIPAENIRAFARFADNQPYIGCFASNPRGFVALTDALKAYGYEPCPEEIEFYDLAQKNIEECEDEDE